MPNATTKNISKQQNSNNNNVPKTRFQNVNDIIIGTAKDRFIEAKLSTLSKTLKDKLVLSKTPSPTKEVMSLLTQFLKSEKLTTTIVFPLKINVPKNGFIAEHTNLKLHAELKVTSIYPDNNLSIYMWFYFKDSDSEDIFDIYRFDNEDILIELEGNIEKTYTEINKEVTELLKKHNISYTGNTRDSILQFNDIDHNDINLVDVISQNYIDTTATPEITDIISHSNNPGGIVLVRTDRNIFKEEGEKPKKEILDIISKWDIYKKKDGGARKREKTKVSYQSKVRKVYIVNGKKAIKLNGENLFLDCIRGKYRYVS